MMRTLRLLVVVVAVGCSSSKHGSGSACDPSAPKCDTGLVCEPLQAGSAACYAPVQVSGTVADLGTAAPIDGAHVVALDPSRSPLSSVAVSAKSGTTDGAYELQIDHATRDATGKP